VVVVPGAWVQPGDLLGHCGNSGRSPQPHIHLHVQTSDEPGSPTAAFHLASVMVTEPEQAPRYELSLVPAESSTLVSALEGYARPLYLLAGRGLRYAVAHNAEAASDWTLHCEVDAQGRMALVSSRGARCLAESTWAVFSCYERNDIADPYFDLWLLACGYTPASIHVSRWQDHCTAAQLLPQAAAKWSARLFWPWATFATSEHQRHWHEQTQAWQQDARHQQAFTGLMATTQARIVPQVGCTYLTAQMGRDRYTLQANSSFQKADMGVPAWETPLTKL
jgi:murein DD-endopeptidase MepM/ murein hydrolase activator NlpD